MAQTLMTISNVLLVLALLSIAATVIVFFKFQIRDVIAELTGKSARKSIEQLREDNIKNVRRSTEPLVSEAHDSYWETTAMEDDAE